MLLSFRGIFLVIILPALLTACATSQNGAPVESRSGAAGSGYAPPSQVDIALAERPTPVRRLLRSAEVQEGSGRYGVAVSTLERALRIAPKDALIWQRLSAVRLKQGRWQLAIQMATKSNSLAAGDLDKLRRLRRDNWELIAHAYQSLGNTQSANHARQQARLLSELL